jgi:hypothetical protein
MKWLLLLVALTIGPLWAAEPTASPEMTRKLKARLKETVAPEIAQAIKETPLAEEPVLVLEPIVVTESRGARELGKQLAAAEERRKAEAFAPAKGGTIYKSDRVVVGSWWDPVKGWTFLKLKW